MGGKQNALTPQPNSLPPPAATGSCGHRERLLEKYTERGLSAFSDYEVLEFLLTFALTRIDTKPLAKTLLHRYNTVSAVINAPFNELCEIKGVGKRSATLLTLVKDLMAYCLREGMVNKDVITQRGDVENYLRTKLKERRDEYVIALYLDNGNRVLGDEIVAEGTVNRCVIFPRKVIEGAIKRSAASFILVHNHPGGTAAASEEDWKTTERLYNAGKQIDIPMLDHIIISKDKAVSLREFKRWPE
ncbi:MAG: DNA repair protein RadC [Chitinispirillales bacterium]|nr:DNA repair protein RadC [Chitinispirillales bacterium]